MPDPIQKARSLLGVKYKWGGNDCNGVDCSGLTKHVYPDLPRLAGDQKKHTQAVDTPQPGDLAFLRRTIANRPDDWATHTGIVTDRGTIIHASSKSGKVVEVPLSHFTASKNFFGYGRPNSGTSPTMPTSKNKKLPAAPIAPQPQRPTNLYGSMANAFNPDGSVDPARFLAHFMASQGASGAANEIPYFNPFAPTEAPNPAYNPRPTYNPFEALGIAMPTGDAPMPNRPYDERKTVQTPALVDQRNAAEKQSLQNAVPESEKEAAKLKAQAKLLQAQAEMLKHNPPAQMEMPENLPFPTREQAEIPNRPAPQLDPMSAALAAIAGMVDPRAAGQYGAVPFQAGVQNADREYADQMRNYQLVTEQLAQKYEQEMAERNDQKHYANRRADVNFANAQAAREAALQEGQLAAQQGYNSDLSSVLSGFIPREQAAAASGLEAQQINRTISEQLAQNQARSNAEAKAAQLDSMASKNAFGFLSNLYNAQSRLSGVQDTNETRETISQANNTARKEMNAASNTSREAAATTRSNAMIKAAEIRAAAAGKRAGGVDVSKYPAGWRESIEAAKRNWSNAESTLSRAIRDAAKQFSHDALIDPTLRKDQYMTDYVKPFETRANQMRTEFESLKAKADAELKATGKPVPTGKIDTFTGAGTAPASSQRPPAAGKPTAPAKATAKTPPVSGFTNLRIRAK